MIRFIEDLGIVPNKDKPVGNWPSLKQGQKMKEYERTYTFFNMNRIRKLETDTYPSKKDNVKTIVETMESIESANKANSATVLNNTLSANEQKFYKALAEYSNTIKMLERETAEHKDSGLGHSILCETLGKQYEAILSISSLIEKELELVQSSNKELGDEFTKRKHDLTIHIEKLKQSREKLCGGKEREFVIDIETIPINFIIFIIFCIIVFIYQILYEKNTFYVYLVFLIIAIIGYIRK